MKRIIVIGGGLAGLLSAIQLVRAGLEVTLIEKKTYPFHRVCGEYVSNEVSPFLKSLDLLPQKFSPADIKRFELSSINGKRIVLPLDLGGFGISRYAFDNFLYEKAKQLGVDFLLNTEAEAIDFADEKFTIKTQVKELEADVLIGAYGKRSKLDVQMNRDFIKKRSPFVGIKYHVKTDYPTDLVSLHNFKNGYCGVCSVEDGKTNICYLSHRNNLKRYKDIHSMEQEILFANPLLKSIFINSDFIFNKPEVINEISFETKLPVENHILMVGDAAGMITPLCGNGMAMAIHASKIASDLIKRFCSEASFTRNDLEREYTYEWRKNFSKRLWLGRQIQKLFGSTTASNVAVHMAINVRPLANLIIKSTHGHTF